MEEIPSPPKIVRILTASRSPVNLKHLLKAPHREILWAVDLKNAARLINENEIGRAHV